jgi:hypothetical protein
VRWSASHGITDLAAPPNPFAGGEWTYTLDPNASFAGNIVISEIMFNPLGGKTTDEWIELHNVSANLVNLSGWRFTRGVDFTFPNVSISPGGYLVVAANVAAFQVRYPGVTNVVGGWTGRLANSEETIELVTALDEAVNSVHYASEGDWARRERGRRPAGHGRGAQRQHRDPDRLWPRLYRQRSGDDLRRRPAGVQRHLHHQCRSAKHVQHHPSGHAGSSHRQFDRLSRDRRRHVGLVLVQRGGWVWEFARAGQPGRPGVPARTG